MKWCPMTLRVETDDPKTASGIYIYDEARQIELVLSVSEPFAQQVRLTKGKALGTLDVSMDTVQWEDLVLKRASDLADVMSQISSLGSDFTIMPSKQLTALLFEFSDDEGKKARSSRARNTLFVDPRLHKSKVVIQSSPLAGFHTPLFHGYTSSGVVSFVTNKLVCLDARYLDGMEGGCVSGAGLSDGSIGLVAGSLIKSNGQGRLTLVVPWASIINVLPDISFLGTHLATAVPVGREWTGVVVVQLKLKGNRVSWGSGVLIGPDLIVTNNHVVGTDYTKLDVWLERRYPYNVAAVSQPLQGLDLVFIKLNKHVPGKYKPIQLAASDPPEKAPVTSRGYGLFLPHRYGGALQPLTSHGIINRAVDGMLISSAGCWNGSSGGALLNANNELVGVMASNARDNESGEIIPDLSFVIPVSLVRKALERLHVPDGEFPVTTSPEFQKLWKLQRTHQDVQARRHKSRI